MLETTFKVPYGSEVKMSSYLFMSSYFPQQKNFALFESLKKCRRQWNIIEKTDKNILVSTAVK